MKNNQHGTPAHRDTDCTHCQRQRATYIMAELESVTGISAASSTEHCEQHKSTGRKDASRRAIRQAEVRCQLTYTMDATHID